LEKKNMPGWTKERESTHSIRFPSGSLQYTLFSFPTAPVRSTTFEPSRIYALEIERFISATTLTRPKDGRMWWCGFVTTHLNPSLLPSSQNLLNRSFSDETQIAAPWLDVSRLGLKFFAGQVKVDLLIAEF
jgi:hypothetical protein